MIYIRNERDGNSKQLKVIIMLEKKLRLIIVLLLFLAGGWRGDVEAQESEVAVGQVEIINAIDVETVTKVQVGQLKMMGGQGMPAGSTSGVLALFAGQHSVMIENALCTPSSLKHSLEIEVDKAFALILYADTKVADDGTAVHEPKILELKKQVEGVKPELVLVSFSRKATVDITMNGKVTPLPAKLPKEVDVKMEDSITFKQGGEPIGMVEILIPGNYIVFFFDKPEGGGLDCVVLEHTKFIYDPPRESFDDDKGEE
jgi:hypothetical protein